MAIHYVGPRPVIKGRNWKDNVRTVDGKQEEYSNFSNFNTSNALDGAPNNNHVPGEGRHPHGLKWSRLFRGLENAEQPLDDPGRGPRLEGARYRPLENKAAGNNKVFKANYGHAPGTPVQGEEQYGITDWIYDGVTKKPLSGDFGHNVRGVDAEGTANTFGRHNPWNYDEKSITGTPLEDPGNDTTFDIDDNTTAHKQINVWKGVPSAKAL